MALCMRASSRRMICTAKADIYGQTRESTMDNGKTIKWMDSDQLGGPMVGSILETINRTKSRVKEFIFGRMEKSSQEIGTTANKMEQDYTFLKMEKKKLGNGFKANEPNGSMRLKSSKWRRKIKFLKKLLGKNKIEMLDYFKINFTR